MNSTDEISDNTIADLSVDSLLAKHWHHLPQEEVETLLDANSDKGLDRFEVKNRRAYFGHNLLSQSKRISPLMLFLSQFNQPLVYILIVAGVITFALNEWVDSTVIFGVVIVNAIIGYVQECKALQAIDALAKSMEGSARVIRAGELMVVPSSELVPGDLVLLQSGDKVPADLRLLLSRELQIDESALTGESVSSEKHPQTLPKQTLLADRSNMAYSSTLVTYGTGTGLVVATGDHSEVGRINALVAEATTIATPLTIKITAFSRKLLWIILALSVVTFVAGWFHGNPLLDSFMASVALAVSVIPEGLPAAMTIILAIGVNKMAKRHAIIRKIPAVETLGSTTVICSDKTGTLTQNQMTVQQVYAGGQLYEVSGVGYAPLGDITRVHAADDFGEAHEDSALIACLKAGLLCNDAQIKKSLEGGTASWTYDGEPTELAMVTVAGKAGLYREDYEADLPRIDVLPFESQHRYMASLHRQGDESAVYVKGSVEAILSRCLDQASGGGEYLDKVAVLQQVAEMANKGLRVLAFACKTVPAETSLVSHAQVASGLTFLGLQAMMDPPREEAISAVEACQSAGIQVKMITGDHILTAAAIAQKIGIKGADGQHYDDYAISGDALGALSDQELVEVAQRIVVFARVSPEQKLRLVEALQAEGHVVAMTGDGVNDAPALKQSNIGVAMGVGGTEVAKEAADMVLTNDNFATIKAAVEEGRAVFDNLIKFITWTLPTSFGEGLTVLVAILFGLTLPITPVQILWVNMTTTIFLGMMLAFEDKEPGLMNRKPRLPDTPVITRELLFRITLVSILLMVSAFSLFEWALQSGKRIEVARTLAVNMFVFGELFYLLNCRSLRYSIFKLGLFTNSWLLLGMVVMSLSQILFTYSETMNHLFGSAPLTLFEWSLILASSLLIYTVIGMEKWFRRIAEDREAQE